MWVTWKTGKRAGCVTITVTLLNTTSTHRANRLNVTSFFFFFLLPLINRNQCQISGQHKRCTAVPKPARTRVYTRKHLLNSCRLSATSVIFTLQSEWPANGRARGGDVMEWEKQKKNSREERKKEQRADEKVLPWLIKQRSPWSSHFLKTQEGREIERRKKQQPGKRNNTAKGQTAGWGDRANAAAIWWH